MGILGDFDRVADALEAEFVSACGAIGPLRLAAAPADGGTPVEWTLTRPFAVIGRGPEADLVLNHEDVSRRHAYLQCVRGRWFCVDLGSRRGLQREGSTIRSGWLDSWSPLEIGPFTLNSPNAPPDGTIDAGSPLEPDPQASGTPGVLLEFPRRGGERLAWSMNRALALVGRSRACRVRLVDPAIHSYHCALARTPEGLWVVSLRDGELLVNRREVRFARLGEGDEVTVGRHQITVRFATVGLPALAPPTVLTPALVAPSFSANSDPTFAIIAQLASQFGTMQQQMLDQFQQAMTMMAQMFCALHREQAEAVRDELERLRNLNQHLSELQSELRICRDGGPRPAPEAVPTPSRPAEESSFRRDFSGIPDAGLSVGAASSADIHALLNRRIEAIQQERQGRWQRLLDLMSNGGPGGAAL